MTAVRIGDEPLTPAAVVAAARSGPNDVKLTPAARERIARARAVAEAVAERRAVYGRTTGVGANLRQAVHESQLLAHSQRLLRSHAGGAGDPLPDELVRATLLIRLAQMAAGGGGHRPEIADVLVAVLRGGPCPSCATWAASARALSRCWLSSAWRLRARASGRGLGSAPRAGAVSERLRSLTAGAPEAARMQDLFGLRCLPPVAGALHDAAVSLHDMLAVEINAAAANPLVAGADVLHHGGFHAASCALALETLRLALVPFASMSAARLAHLMEPRLSGLTPFLAADAPGSPGVLIAGYLAADALARLRADAAPVVLGTVAISRGLEDRPIGADATLAEAQLPALARSVRAAAAVPATG
jgi:histidine ammonia-lyase